MHVCVRMFNCASRMRVGVCILSCARVCEHVCDRRVIYVIFFISQEVGLQWEFVTCTIKCCYNWYYSQR